MEIRPLIEADLSAVVDLCQRTLPYDHFTLPLLRRRIFDDPQPEPAFLVSAWEGERLTGVMLGAPRTTGEGLIGSIKLFAVDPPARRRGLAGRLLAEVEGRMQAVGITKVLVGGSAPNYLWPGLDLRYTPAYCFLERHGYRFTTGMVNMQVELPLRDWGTAVDEERLATEGFVVRRLAPDDREQFAAWLQATWGAGWLAEGIDGYRNDPPSVHIAQHEGQIVSFACYNVEAFDGGFGPTGTNEALRGKGLGRVLFYRCMQDLVDQGLTEAEICWVGPISFYARIADAWINRTFWGLTKDI